MFKGKDTILVMGATGNQGNAVAKELLLRGHRVRAITRKVDGPAAKALAALGAEVVRGDFDDVASVEQAMTGVWGAFAVQNTWEAGVEREEEQGKRVAEIARRKGVGHFVYTSVGSANRNTGIPHFDNKYRVEQRVRGLGFPSYAILRPVFFMENLASPWFKPAIDDGKLAVAMAPETRLQMIAVADIGRYGALAFEAHEQMNGRAIDLAGDALTMPETAAALSLALKRKVEFVRPPIEAVRQSSADFAKMLEWFDSDGYDAPIRANFGEFKIRPTSFAEWLASSPAWG